jgi:hypothetical protein
MSKARPSSLDLHADKLREWFFLEKPAANYATALARLEKEGIKTSIGALCRWWQREVNERRITTVLGNIATGAELDRKLKDGFKKNPPPELETLIKLLQTIIAHLSLRGTEEPEILKVALAAFDRVFDYHSKLREEAKLAQAADQLTMDREKLDLLKAKAAQAEAAKQVMQDDLSDEEKAARMKEVFGLS